MPHHIHGVVILNDRSRDGMETQNIASLQTQSPVNNRFGPQSGNLASVIRGFKVGVTSYASQQGFVFNWQPRFHDHIIRTQKEMNGIAEYIENNVAKWEFDELNKLED